MTPSAPPSRFALMLAGLVTGFAFFTYVALRPLHEHGVWQPVLGFVQGLDCMLQAPGLILAQRLGLRVGHHTTPVAWTFSVAVNAVLLFVAGLAISSFWRRAPVGGEALCRPGSTETQRPPQQASAGDAPEQRGLSRRRFLGTSVGAICGVGLGYSLLIEPRWFTVTRREVRIRGLPPALDGLRVLHLTDIHHGPWLSLAYVRDIVRAGNELEPDLVCLTGDYVHHSSAYIEPVAEELGRLRPKIASVSVLGNHDWWEDGPRMQRALSRAGITLLDNDRRVLTPQRRLVAGGTEGLALCGVGDLWEDRQDYAAALGGLPADMPRLLLSHNPDVAEERGLVQGGRRVDLMLSGHTHGGQVWLPGLGTPLTNSRYGQKYANGLAQGPVCIVFTGRGIGVSGLPIRLCAPPELAVLELRSAASVETSGSQAHLGEHLCGIDPSA